MFTSGKLVPLAFALLVALVAIQIQTQNRMLLELKGTHKKLHLVREEFDDLQQYIKSFEEHNETAVFNGIYEIAGHEPHAHYLKNIKVSDSNPRLPADINREYSYDDFVSVFEVEPLHNVIFEDDVADILKGHDLTNDEYYQNSSKEYFDELVEKFGPLLAQESLEERDREYIAIKFISPEAGFGTFAKKFIKKGELVGAFTGVITADNSNTDYTWNYPTNKVNGKAVSLGTDAIKKGNYLRFANHLGPDCNTEPETVPFNNTWRILYVAVKDIHPGEEITTNYGDAYFETRLV